MKKSIKKAVLHMKQAETELAESYRYACEENPAAALMLEEIQRTFYITSQKLQKLSLVLNQDTTEE